MNPTSTNYYIYLRHEAKNGAVDIIERCQVCTDYTVYFISLSDFLINIIPKGPDYDRFAALRDKAYKVRLDEEDGEGFFDFILHLYEHYTDECYYCQDDKGQKKDFRELWTELRGYSTEFWDNSINRGEYGLDGIDVAIYR